MEYCIVDQHSRVIAEGFKNHKEALEYMKRMNLQYINVNKIELKVKERV